MSDTYVAANYTKREYVNLACYGRDPWETLRNWSAQFGGVLAFLLVSRWFRDEVALVGGEPNPDPKYRVIYTFKNVSHEVAKDYNEHWSHTTWCCERDVPVLPENEEPCEHCVTQLTEEQYDDPWGRFR